RIDDAHARQEKRRGIGQMKIDLITDAPDSLKVVEAQECAAILVLASPEKYRRARERRMAGNRAVPLHAAGEPGISRGEVGRLKNGVGIKQVPPAGLMK